MMVIERKAHLRRVAQLLREFPVVGLLGPRQVGKTTLARQVLAAKRGASSFFDLEDSRDRARLAEPMLALASLRGLVVLDEIQRQPELFQVLRVLADRAGTPARFLVLGSATPDLLRQSSETLAGRIAFHRLEGFDLEEVGQVRLDRLWFRGSFPRAFLARGEAASDAWRREFIRTFLERDLPALGSAMPAASMERFWGMLAHYHGQIWNGSEFGRAFGVSHTTVRKYLDLLTGTFMVLQLAPWAVNLGKRLVKSPKVYLADSGLLHALLGLEAPRELMRHPKVGASWEGFMLLQTTRQLRARADQCYFWATHGGAELDLLVVRGQRRYGFEFKRTDSPRLTPSMRSACETLSLERLDVIHAGSRSFPLAPRVRAVAAGDLLTAVEPLGS
jgi:hypothetical protein